jgi:hypothetical protein
MSMTRLNCAALFCLTVASCYDPGDCEEIPAEHLPTGFSQPCHPGNFQRGADLKVCCPDDPAAAGGLPPDYDAVDAPDTALGEPLFSAARAPWSQWGQCVIDGFSNEDVDLAGCPRPCNPRWSQGRINLVCGGSAEAVGHDCCPTVPTSLEDCVLENGRWRAVRGTDVSVPEDWVVDAAGTRQDPDLSGCTEWATSPSGSVDTGRLADCVANLSSADQRGFCDTLVPGTECPGAEDPALAAAIDPCEAKNQ